MVRAPELKSGNPEFKSPADHKLNLFQVVHPWFNPSAVSLHSHLAPVVQTLDSFIHWINHYPLDISIGFASFYPLDSDLSGGQRYPSFEQLEPGLPPASWDS